MDFKFSNNSNESQPMEAPGEKKKQSALLVLLLLLVGGFTYVYFFTGLIKPQETQIIADVPAPAPQDAKIPLPTREGDPAKSAAKPTEKAEDSKAAPAPATKPVAAPATPAETPAVKPVAAPAKPAEPPSAPPVVAQPKPKEEPNNTEATKPAGKQPLPQRISDTKGRDIVASKAEVKKPATETKKPAVVDKKSTAPVDSAKKPVPASQKKQETVAKTKSSASDSWTLVVGNYVLEGALSTDMGRVRTAGFKPVVKPSERKKTTMNRLFVSEFDNRATALSTMGLLKRHTSDVFIIDQGGRFAVYAGSYLQIDAANSEKERLKTAGITTTLKQIDIAIPSQSLSIGPFKNRKEADDALNKLKTAGIKATLSQK